MLADQDADRLVAIIERADLAMRRSRERAGQARNMLNLNVLVRLDVAERSLRQERAWREFRAAAIARADERGVPPHRIDQALGLAPKKPTRRERDRARVLEVSKQYLRDAQRDVIEQFGLRAR